MKVANRISTKHFIALAVSCSVLWSCNLSSSVDANELVPKSAPEQTPNSIQKNDAVLLKAGDPIKTEPQQASEDSQSTTLDVTSKPTIKLGLDQSSFNLGASESMIAWERWHHTVGRAIHKRVQKATLTTMGEVELDIRITKDCKLTAQILKSSNAKIGELCQNATQSLDGDTILIFPIDSKRQSVHFKFEYRRGLFFLPKNHYITDDYERLNDEQR